MLDFLDGVANISAFPTSAMSLEEPSGSQFARRLRVRCSVCSEACSRVMSQLEREEAAVILQPRWHSHSWLTLVCFWVKSPACK